MSDDWHQCHFCGTFVKYGYETQYVVDGVEHEGGRHWLSDCRPDLVEHEIGPTCTWWNLARTQNMPQGDCYAYQDRATNEWTDQHVHFYKDGPT